MPPSNMVSVNDLPVRLLDGNFYKFVLLSKQEAIDSHSSKRIFSSLPYKAYTVYLERPPNYQNTSLCVSKTSLSTVNVRVEAYLCICVLNKNANSIFVKIYNFA